ncbi:hypothetical protein CQ009_20220 [Pseudomonas sp. MYb2]|nr:hypothetical protein CQ025_15595 [Pseudomonas sp. MYb3]PRC32000.1 hypothetical protein CQ009_20220 [Pseudomonas sp. MYb2]
MASGCVRAGRSKTATCAASKISAVRIVPTLCVGMPHRTLRVRLSRDAERPGLHSHAERRNDQLNAM